MPEADKHLVLGSRRAGAGLHLAGLVVSSLAGRPPGAAAEFDAQKQKILQTM